MREFVIYAVFALFLCSTAQDIGEICRLRDLTVGYCERISNCQSAQDELKRRIKPILCDFDKSEPIVCCKNKTESEIVKRRISERKCEEYLKLNVITTITTTTTTTPKYIPIVVGGINAKFEEFTHMGILGYGSKSKIEFQCGASLISEQFVLTAAHCLESREFGPVSLVRLGDLDIASDLDLAEPQDFKVSEIYPHPEYDFKSFYNDIALIKLDRPVIYTRYVKPACLQTTFNLERDTLTATGWGALYYGGTSHSFLQKVEIFNLPLNNCLPTYGPSVKLPRGIDGELQICGGNQDEIMDTCQGDSGGPLQLKIQLAPTVHKIVGITSFGKNCGLVPGVYTRVSKYISWIESIVWPNSA